MPLKHTYSKTRVIYFERFLPNAGVLSQGGLSAGAAPCDFRDLYMRSTGSDLIHVRIARGFSQSVRAAIHADGSYF